MTVPGLKVALTRIIPYVMGTSKEQRLSILSYHRVMERLDPMRPTEPTIETFDWQMELLSSCFNPLPLSEAVTKMKDGNLPDRAVAVTFDDGYADNYTLALPILKKWGVPATVFVATGFLNGGSMWNDRIIESVRVMPGGKFDLRILGIDRALSVSEQNRPMLAQEIISLVKHWEPLRREEAVEKLASIAGNPPCDFMLTTAQLRQLCADGVEIGGHTHSHPILASIEDAQARQEILHGKKQLEDILKAPLNVFAYPNGKKHADFNEVHKQFVAEAGFDSAVSTEVGVSNRMSDPYQLPRFTPWDATPLRFLLRLHASRRNVSVAHA